MRSRRNLTILAIICLSLMLRADSCLIEQKDVALIIPAEVPFEWVTTGHTGNTDTSTDTFDAAGPIRDGLASDPLPGDLEAINVSGVLWRVVESTDHSTRRVGDVSVTFDEAWVDSDGITHTVGPYNLLEFDVPNNDTGTSGSASDGYWPEDPGPPVVAAHNTVTFAGGGVAEINARLNAWLTAYKANPADLSLDGLLTGTGTANWDSTTEGDPPTTGDPDNFTWVTDLVIQVEKTVRVDAPK